MIFEKPTYSELDDKVNPFFFSHWLTFQTNLWESPNLGWAVCQWKQRKGKLKPMTLNQKKKFFYNSSANVYITDIVFYIFHDFKPTFFLFYLFY